MFICFFEISHSISNVWLVLKAAKPKGFGTKQDKSCANISPLLIRVITAFQ